MTWAFEPALICCSWCNAPIIIVIISRMILPKEPAYKMQCQDCVGEVDQVKILRFDSILLMGQNPADQLRLVVYCLLATNYRNFSYITGPSFLTSPRYFQMFNIEIYMLCHPKTVTQLELSSLLKWLVSAKNKQFIGVQQNKQNVNQITRNNLTYAG